MSLAESQTTGYLAKYLNNATAAANELQHTDAGTIGDFMHQNTVPPGQQLFGSL